MLWSADKYRKWHSYFIVRIISHVFAAISQNDPMIVCETPSNSYWKKRNKRTVRNDRNHQKRIETMQTKKSPNDNVNNSNAERNASLDLDLTCWIILSAKFSVKYIYESKNDWRSSCVLLDSTQAPYEKPHEPVSLRTQKEVLAHAFFLGCMFCNQVAILFHIFILFLVRIGSDHNLHIFKNIYIYLILVNL